jgi:hypothetical protein
MGIQQQQEIIVLGPLAAFILLFQSLADQVQAEATGMVMIPVLIADFACVRMQPDDVPDAGAADALPLKEVPPAQRRMLVAQPDQATCEFEGVPGCPPARPAPN